MVKRPTFMAGRSKPSGKTEALASGHVAAVTMFTAAARMLAADAPAPLRTFCFASKDKALLRGFTRLLLIQF